MSFVKVDHPFKITLYTKVLITACTFFFISSLVFGLNAINTANFYPMTTFALTLIMLAVAIICLGVSFKSDVEDRGYTLVTNEEEIWIVLIQDKNGVTFKTFMDIHVYEEDERLVFLFDGEEAWSWKHEIQDLADRDQVKGNIENLLTSRDDIPQGIIVRNLLHCVFPTHPI